MSSTRFHQARLKYEWANKHIDQLQAQWLAYLETDFCRLTVEDHPNSRQSTVRANAEPLPNEIVLTLGDAIHNLKSALDYAVSEILGWKNTRLTFPMGETREELVSSFRTDDTRACSECGRGNKAGRNAAIEMAVPGFGEFLVNEIRPYKAADGYLWPLNKLDVRDKHRLLIPVVVPNTITGISAMDENNCGIVNATAVVGAGGALNLLGAGRGLKIQSHGKPTAEIFFNEVGVIEGKRLFPTLLNMSQAVTETIRLIDDFVPATE
jgi:hypothetical protein